MHLEYPAPDVTFYSGFLYRTTYLSQILSNKIISKQIYDNIITTCKSHIVCRSYVLILAIWYKQRL